MRWVESARLGIYISTIWFSVQDILSIKNPPIVLFIIYSVLEILAYIYFEVGSNLEHYEIFEK